MIFGSVCSGIEAATAAWHPLGWKPSFFSEIEAFPRAVLSHHYPDIPLHGDFTTIEAGQYEPIDLLVGGTPCQSFSVAGLRGGLADDRGNLALEFLRLAQRLGPRWLVWENVPGVLSSGGGRDFGSILGGMVELGYGIAYRILDAQHFGVPQRRRRVFVVGYLGDWRPAAAVLFERHSLSGDSPPRRDAGQGVAHSITTRAGNGSRPAGSNGNLIAGTLNANGKAAGSATQQDAETGMLVTHLAYRTSANCGAWETGDRIDALTTGTDRTQHVIAFDATGSTADAGLVVPTLRKRSGGAAGHGAAIAIQERAICENPNAGPDGAGFRTDGLAYTLEARTVPQAVAFAKTAVRRLTPRECERLQGFPDDFTLVPIRGKLAADGPRYKALGNSMAVPCMSWIGRRIEMVEGIPPALPPSPQRQPSATAPHGVIDNDRDQR